MSFANPTPLRLGMSGTLHGWKVRIVGRVVMGVEVDGATYYWNEFNLVDPTGNNATLVHEETEDGVEWKLFTLLEPKHPLTVAEAEAKDVGDTVNLDGRPIAVTLADESRVYHIEGTAPEGVQVGDVARYLNADAGERMLVASWTGDEIEFYEGRDLRGEEVFRAFGVTASTRLTAAQQFRGSDIGGGLQSMRRYTWIVIAVLGLVALLGAYTCSRGTRQTANTPPPKQAASAVQLANGVTGQLGQQSYRIESQALVEVARVGRRHDRREYELVDAANQRALLVNALNGGTREWHLLLPAQASGSLAAVPAYEAAAKRKGAPVTIDGRTLQVTDLFLTKVEVSGGATRWPALQYGFVASAADNWLMARWTESAIQFHQGRQVSESEVVAAFGRAPAK